MPMKRPSRSKFNVNNSAAGKLRRCLNGIVFDSAAERDYAAELDHKVKTKQIAGYRRQVPYPLFVFCDAFPRSGFGVEVCKIVVDFEVAMRDGTVQVEEVKGYETELWKLKEKMFRACYPDIKYVVVKPKRK